MARDTSRRRLRRTQIARGLIAASEGGAPVSRGAALTFVIDRATVSGNALAEAAAAMRTHPEQMVFG